MIIIGSEMGNIIQKSLKCQNIQLIKQEIKFE